MKFKIGDTVRVAAKGIIGHGTIGRVISMTDKHLVGRLVVDHIEYPTLVKVEIDAYGLTMEVDYSECCLQKISWRSIDEAWENSDGSESAQSGGPDDALVSLDVQRRPIDAP